MRLILKGAGIMADQSAHRHWKSDSQIPNIDYYLIDGSTANLVQMPDSADVYCTFTKDTYASVTGISFTSIMLRTFDENFFPLKGFAISPTNDSYAAYALSAGTFSGVTSRDFGSVSNIKFTPNPDTPSYDYSKMSEDDFHDAAEKLQSAGIYCLDDSGSTDYVLTTDDLNALLRGQVFDSAGRRL